MQSDKVQIRTHKQLDITKAKHPAPTRTVSSNVMGCYDETSGNYRCTVSIRHFSVLHATLRRQERIRIQLWSQWGESGERLQQGREHPHVKLTWEGEKWGRNGGMRGWIKQSLLVTRGLPWRILKLNLLKRTVCVRACVCLWMHAYLIHVSERLCVRMCVHAHLVSVHMRVMQYTFRGPCLRHTAPMNRWKMN